MNGFVKIHRSLIRWEWYDDISTSKLFLHLILIANFKETKWRGIDLKIGETIKSLRTLSKESGLSIRQIRTSLEKLEATQEVTQRRHNKSRIIKVENYNMYQVTDTKHDTIPTRYRHDSDTIATQGKERKERKECKERKEEDKKITPKEFSKLFFKNKEFQEKAISFLVEKNKMNYDEVSDEVNKFVNYWTELDQNGTKQRWEAQKTFETHRRLTTWFLNAHKWNKSNKKDFIIPDNF